MENQTSYPMQEALEDLFSKYQLLDVLRDDFSTISEDPFIIDVLSQIYLHKQADPSTLVGILVPKHGSAQEVADKLLQACKDDFLDFDPERQMFSVRYGIDEELQIMLDRYQYPLPSVVKPNKVKGYYDTGYQTIKRPTILNGSDYFKDKDLCIDHLDRANSVALSINVEVVSSMAGKFQVPVRKVGEDFGPYRQRVKQAQTFYDTSLEVMEGLLIVGSEFYLTHRYDRRGRCYSSGYHVQTQGTDYNKAVLQFSKKELVV